METKLKLEISQLKNYLGTGLEFQTSRHQIAYGQVHVIKMNGLSLDDMLNIEFLYNDDLLFSNRMKKVYPIMYRLQDLDKFIPELGFVPLDEIGRLFFDKQPDSFCDEIDARNWNEVMFREYGPEGIDFWIVQKLFEWHFWVFDQEYFTDGLIIDKLKHGN